MTKILNILFAIALICSTPYAAAQSELAIREAGEYNLTDQMTIVVTSKKGPEGHTRNWLDVIYDNGIDNPVTDRCALTYGSNTWRVLAQWHPNTENNASTGAVITLADRWGVSCYRFRPDTKQPGFDHKPFASTTYEQAFNDKWPTTIDAQVIDWSRRFLPLLKQEPQSFSPGLEVRLVVDADKQTQQIRPTLQRRQAVHAQLTEFVHLGEVILQEKHIQAQLVIAGICLTQYAVKEDQRQAFETLCKNYPGRQAAVIHNGSAAVFDLDDYDPETGHLANHMAIFLALDKQAN